MTILRHLHFLPHQKEKPPSHCEPEKSFKRTNKGGVYARGLQNQSDEPQVGHVPLVVEAATKIAALRDIRGGGIACGGGQT